MATITIPEWVELPVATPLCRLTQSAPLAQLARGQSATASEPFFMPLVSRLGIYLRAFTSGRL